jgi:hypothetical protein
MPDLDGKLRLHDRVKLTVTRIGTEHQPVIVVDDFLENPRPLVDYAAGLPAFGAVSDAFYPGIRAPIPPIYCFALRAFLGKAIADTFGLRDSVVTGELSHFSLVTTPPAKLSTVQRMPHFDNANPKQLALLHYLCGSDQGGTSFYRHRRTGFEFIDEARKDRYADAVAEDFARLGMPSARYICGDDVMFERTLSIAAAFNRLIIYRSINLHSADIAPAFAFDGTARGGRLTANTFFYYR